MAASDPVVWKPQNIKVAASRTSEGNEKYTIFVIMVSLNEQTSWTIDRRFSEFDTLHGKLGKHHSVLPRLPGKTWKRDLTLEFIERRRQALDAYIKDLAKIPYVVNSKVFADFINLEKYLEIDRTTYLPQPLKSLTEAQFGISAFVFDGKENVIFTACKDVSVLSRFDSRISNIKFPWEKNAGTIVPLGAVTCYVEDSDEAWKTMSALYFDCGVTAINWDSKSRYLWVGLENGHVMFYFVDSSYKEFTALNELDVHRAEVSALYHNPEDDLLITASHDKRMVVYDLKQDKVVSAELAAPAAIVSIVFDSASRLGFLGTISEHVLVYDFKKVPPTLLRRLTGHTSSVRSLYYHGPTRALYSGGSNGVVGVWSIQSEKLDSTQSMGWLNDGAEGKMSCLVYLGYSKQVVAGYASGKMFVWDAAAKKLAYVIQAHDGAVSQMHWIDSAKTMITSSFDGKLKFWRFPDAVEWAASSKEVKSRRKTGSDEFKDSDKPLSRESSERSSTRETLPGSTPSETHESSQTAEETGMADI